MKYDFSIKPRGSRPLLKLDADFKKRWVEALRSGTYAQTKSYLHTAAGFCCLGVACDVTPGTVWENTYGTVEGKTFIFETGGVNSMPSPESLPEGVYEVLFQPTDLVDRYPEIDADCDVDIGLGCSAPSVMSSLAQNNDDGASFSEIADWIEANL